MIGARPLTTEEIKSLDEHFDRIAGDPAEDKYDTAARDKALMFLSLNTGFRIAETLSLRVGDVWAGRMRDSVALEKENTKGKIAGRRLPMNADCKRMLEKYLDHYGMKKDPEKALFPSRVGGALSTRMGLKLFKKAFEACDIKDSVSCHSTRKTFARAMFDAMGNSHLDLKRALGHRNLSSTEKYIEPMMSKIEAGIAQLKFCSKDPLP